jgi:hypothetical protein
MLKTDLRLGNLVEYPGWNKDGTSAFFKVRDIFWEDDKLALTNGIIQLPQTRLEYIKPIPITLEWMEKLGFEKTDDYGDQIYYEPKDRDKRHYYICFDHDDISFGLSVFGNCTSLIYDDKNLQYVHQFQNLYYALTGVELSVS